MTHVFNKATTPFSHSVIGVVLTLHKVLHNSLQNKHLVLTFNLPEQRLTTLVFVMSTMYWSPLTHSRTSNPSLSITLAWNKQNNFTYPFRFLFSQSSIQTCKLNECILHFYRCILYWPWKKIFQSLNHCLVINKK